MFRDQARYGRDPNVVVRAKTTFYDPMKWDQPKRIFVCSWSDFFIEEADPWREEAYAVMRAAPQHTYLILTKRPERIADRLPDDWGNGWPNVWLGVSAENQAMAEKRIPILVKVSAEVRWVSAEPLLGPIDLSPWLWLMEPVRYNPRYDDFDEERVIQWVVAGGESGPDHRPMDMAWARSLRDRCVKTEVAFFFKQDSDPRPGQRPWIVEEDGTQTAWRQFPGHVPACEQTIDSRLTPQ